MRIVHIVLSCLLILLCKTSTAQEVTVDSTMIQASQTPVFADSLPQNSAVVSDTVAQKSATKKVFEPNPKKAGLYSAILPGLGQIYDRKYWKLPIVYGGLGVGAYFIKYNSDNYRLYRKAYISRRDADPNNDELTDIYTNAEDLKQLQDEYKKYLDLTILITAVAYTTQIIDAIVFAHLKNFDVSPNISMRVTPVVQTNYIGFGLAVNFK